MENMINWKDEYKDERTKKRETGQRFLVAVGFAGFVTFGAILAAFHMGFLDEEPLSKPDDSYDKPIQNPVNRNETLSLILNLRSDIIGAQSPILVAVTLEVHPFDVTRNFTSGELLDANTMKPLPKYIRMLFNGTTCTITENILDREYPCWIDLQMNDLGGSDVTYTGIKTIYYSHGGYYDITLAYPYTDSPERSSVNERFIQIESVEATSLFVQAQKAYDQWKTVVIIAGIAALVGGIQLYIRLFWWVNDRANFSQ
ncbi:MAG: hypothetical protein ACREBU_07060 [Nitrososphaera sp.]